jgi:hypothetical protein
MAKNDKIEVPFATMARCAKTMQINRGGMMAVELRESFVQVQSVAKTRILFF